MFYYQKFSSCQGESRKTWSTINDILKRSNNINPPDYLIIDGQKQTNQRKIVNHFNTYFGNIGTEMASSIPINAANTFTDYLLNNVST